MTRQPFPIWTVYENPTDFPGKFVARLWDLDQPTDQIKVADTLREIRAELMPLGLHRLERQPEDDPHILETWL